MLALVGSCFVSASARAQAGGSSLVEPRLEPASVQAADAAELQVADNGAKSADLGRARTLFQRGVEFANQGDYAAAAKRFREALELHYAPAIAYNLASALSETGQHAEAYDVVQSVLRDPSTPEALRVRAQRLDDSLQRSVARLTVVISSDEAEVSVLVDGKPLAAQLVGMPRAVEPGDHVVVAQRAGVSISQRSVRIPIGTAALVDLSLVMTPRQAAEAATGGSDAASALPVLTSGPAEGPRDDDEAKRRRRLWIIGGASAVAVAVGAGVALALLLAKPAKHSESPVAGDGMPGVLVWK